MSEKPKLLAVIRVRGKVHVRKNIEDTLKLLRLNSVNHCVLIPENQNYKGMLNKVNDYVTWGEVDEKTITKLLKKRGRITGDKPLTDEYLAQESDVKTISDLSKKLLDGGLLKDVKGIKPVFRLNPPVGGHERGGIKKNIKVGGALGNRGKEINKLLEAML